MLVISVFLGKKYRDRDARQKNRPIIAAAILIDSFELLKIILLSVRQEDPMHFVYDLPLFLCSIQLITIPLAAFSKGRIKEAALDFVTIFGMLGAILGTYCAGNNYGSYPVISFDNVVSGITHCISGFTSLYIILSGTVSMKKRNMPITVCILSSFCVMAYVANIFTDANYMFLSRGDGTPYDILFDLVNGHHLLYPMSVFFLFIIYIAFYYGTFYLVEKRKEEKSAQMVGLRG